jgi:hypothetical protein
MSSGIQWLAAVEGLQRLVEEDGSLGRRPGTAPGMT